MTATPNHDPPKRGSRWLFLGRPVKVRQVFGVPNDGHVKWLEPWLLVEREDARESLKIKLDFWHANTTPAPKRVRIGVPPSAKKT